MPLGVFLLQWTDEGFQLRANFHDNPEIIEELVMRLSINHGSVDTFARMPTRNDTTILSLYHEFKDENRKEQKIIVGIDMGKEDSREENEILLKEIVKMIPEHIHKDDKELGSILYAMYVSNQQVPAGDGVNDDIKIRLVQRAKNLIKKQEIDKAQELLELAKTVPARIKELIEKGNALLKDKKIPDAERIFSEAITLARKIGEDELAERLSNQVTRTTEKPKVIEKIKKLEEQALKAMKALKIKKAAEAFLKASKEAFKINDIDAMNEFLRKHELLAEFHAVDNDRNRSFK